MSIHISDTESLNRRLAKWQCHKIVCAAKIVDIRPTKESMELELEELCGGGFRVQVTLEWLGRHRPREGGYLVVYRDGYTSFSPREAFEEGYTLL